VQSYFKSNAVQNKNLFYFNVELKLAINILYVNFAPNKSLDGLIK